MERIPDLMTIGSFTTSVGQSVSLLPEGFSGRLLKVGSKEQEIVIHPGGLEGLLGDCDNFGSTVGEVSIVGQEGSNIWYYGIPATATTYPILYQKDAELLESDSDELPRWLPSYFGRGLVSHHAAAILYGIIEDGVEQDKVNTNAQLMLAEKYAGQFRNFLTKNRKGYQTSIWSE
jgi:hypothetical protein